MENADDKEKENLSIKSSILNFYFFWCLVSVFPEVCWKQAYLPTTPSSDSHHTVVSCTGVGIHFPPTSNTIPCVWPYLITKMFLLKFSGNLFVIIQVPLSLSSDIHCNLFHVWKSPSLDSAMLFCSLTFVINLHLLPSISVLFSLVYTFVFSC